MRSISIEGLKSMFAAHTGDVVCGALTVISPDGSNTFRFVKNSKSISYDGNTYQPLPLQIQLAPDVEEKAPIVRVSIDNISRELVDEIRTWQDNPDIEIEVFRIDSSGTVTRELGPQSFELRNVEYDAKKIQAELGFEHDILNNPATKDRFTPNIAPALF